VTPERFAEIKQWYATYGRDHAPWGLPEFIPELVRQSAALFEDAQCEADSHWGAGVHPVDADALVLGGTDEEGWDWCCLAHLPANLPPERVIWRLTA
jgi:hypothetical protein